MGAVVHKNGELVERGQLLKDHLGTGWRFQFVTQAGALEVVADKGGAPAQFLPAVFPGVTIEGGSNV